MRTTVDLDADLAVRLRREARDQGITFKAALNRAVRKGLSSESAAAVRYRVRAKRMGLRPGVDLTKSSQLADELVDQAILQKLDLRT